MAIQTLYNQVNHQVGHFVTEGELNDKVWLVAAWLFSFKAPEHSGRKARRRHEPLCFLLSRSADQGHGEHSGAEEAAHGPGHLHEDSGLLLHCHLLRSAVQRGNVNDI